MHNFFSIRVAKCRRNRIVDLVVDGMNRKETLFFTFKMFYLKRLPVEDVKTATVKNGTRRGHWKEKRNREVIWKAEVT